MGKAFVYGMSVEGENFTDRVKETKRLKTDFENGINVIFVSPRRMGKSSIVKKVKAEKGGCLEVVWNLCRPTHNKTRNSSLKIY